MMSHSTSLKKEFSHMIQAIILLIFGACAIFSAPLVYDTLKNNWTLNKYELAFRRQSHPGWTTSISLEKRVGLLAGNSNHCDYFFGEVRSYTVSKDEISRFYDGQRVENYSYLKVTFIENGGFPGNESNNLLYGLRSIADWGFDPADLQNDLDIVSIL
jgi:hypothetical protein